MEIKRRLNKIAGRLTPQIEVMNVATEMKRMAARFEELLDYAEEKNTRSAERKETIGQQVAKRQEAERKQIEEHQTAEAEENLRDQQESFEERNAVLRKSQPHTEADTTPEPAADDNGDLPEVPEPKPKPAAKKKAKKKKKRAIKKKK